MKMVIKVKGCVRESGSKFYWKIEVELKAGTASEMTPLISQKKFNTRQEAIEDLKINSGEVQKIALKSLGNPQIINYSNRSKI